MESKVFFGYESIFATKLRDLMAENNLTRQKLADEIGVTRQAIGQYCDGITIPNAEKLVKLADYFNVSIEYLVGKTEAKTTDLELKAVCDYTGLSEKAISTLNFELSMDVLEFNTPATVDLFNDFIIKYCNLLLESGNDYFSATQQEIKILEESVEKGGTPFIQGKLKHCEEKKMVALYRLQEALKDLLKEHNREREKKQKDLMIENTTLVNNRYFSKGRNGIEIATDDIISAVERIEASEKDGDTSGNS